MGKIKTTEQFKEEMKVKNPNIEVLGEYINDTTKILVKDKICGHEWNTSNPNRLLKGQICPKCRIARKNKNQIKDKVGEINYNKYGSKMTIVGYRNCKDIDVKFDNGSFFKNKLYTEFKKGNLISPYDRLICGVGYLGEGEHVPTINNKNIPQYYTWLAMIKRCYDEKQQIKQPTYFGCSVDKEWHNFQVFAKWWDENYYKIEGQRMEVDKDILHKGNKVYSPENCIIVPNNINALIISCKKVRGEYPIGVGITESGKFRARYSDAILETRFHLGCFDTPEEAFCIYKKNKEKHIKDVADYYKNKIPQKLYDALYKYEVEITD
jgi:hypothetical protein